MALAAVDAASCRAMAQMPCVFLIALGRTGSSHLLRLLNGIDGYRLSGETDNAWIYMGRYAGARINARSELSNARRERLVSWSSEAVRARANRSDMLCQARQLMLMLHNPLPRARVFGYKEIYSSLVRKPQSHSEIITHGINFTRLLFPRSKFIFHWRQNVSRIAISDFWQREDALSAAQNRFVSLIGRFSEYAAAHSDFAFATTLEGITDRNNQSQLEDLFRFLEEPLSPRLRKMAYGRGGLRDWTEERHTRRIRRTLSNGSVVVEAVEYAWRPGEQEEARAGDVR